MCPVRSEVALEETTMTENETTPAAEAKSTVEALRDRVCAILGVKLIPWPQSTELLDAITEALRSERERVLEEAIATCEAWRECVTGDEQYDLGHSDACGELAEQLAPSRPPDERPH
jgi:hypothetical protein